ncbi:AAA family ATPase [Desulfovibrio sp. OttesenSCG-928-G15]|nr:AAA family ATPase [Desulfovibrio sp. OttesenSCG-928-G15]
MGTPSFIPHKSKVGESCCVSLVGMAGAGKSTIGRELAALLDWAHIDTDNSIEALYGTRLQNLTDIVEKQDFLDLEGEVISRLKLCRCVISTGGSVAYRKKGVDHLKTLGPIVHIAVPLDIVLERIARKPDRGLAIAPGQTLEDLYNERMPLYEAIADFTIPGGRAPAASYAAQIAAWLQEEA